MSTALCILHWGRLSDRIGRRPVILIGLIGLALSMLCFGFAQSFPGVVISRVIAGALNGNVGVTKTMVSSIQLRGNSSNTHGAKIAELGTEENRTMLFTFIPITWIIGATIGASWSAGLPHVVSWNFSKYRLLEEPSSTRRNASQYSMEISFSRISLISYLASSRRHVQHLHGLSHSSLCARCVYPFPRWVANSCLTLVPLDSRTISDE